MAGEPATPRMLAVRQDVAGGPEVLRTVEMDRPVPGPCEILVRVHAAGVNPTDWKTRARGYFNAEASLPFVLGFDISGTVEAVGPGVTIFQPGDEVYGMPRFPHPASAYAQYVATPARHCAPKPPSLDHTHAAALPLAALTAWQALVDTGGVGEGKRVLIHAAAGGVGHLAVQIAKARGAYVIGTASAAKHGFLRRLGADELIDYTVEDFTERVRDVDFVLDPFGDSPATRYSSRSLAVVRRGGVVVSLAPFAEGFRAEEARASGIRAAYLLVEPDQAGLRAITELVESGRLRVAVEAVFPLEEAAKAHAMGETGRVAGKLVLSVANE
jgi:NADPH:quinone reductase-like Zn-dependent oxidoreductase